MAAKKSKNAFLQSLIKKAISKNPVKKIGSLPKLKNMSRPKVSSSFVKGRVSGSSLFSNN